MYVVVFQLNVSEPALLQVTKGAPDYTYSAPIILKPPLLRIFHGPEAGLELIPRRLLLVSRQVRAGDGLDQVGVADGGVEAPGDGVQNWAANDGGAARQAPLPTGTGTSSGRNAAEAEAPKDSGAAGAGAQQQQYRYLHFRHKMCLAERDSRMNEDAVQVHPGGVDSSAAHDAQHRRSLP